MKKSLVALAALAVAGVASAQSSVTLFGIVDAGVSYYQNKADGGAKTSSWQQTNSGYNSSRLGFRGTEDLGGGLAAGFWLEAALGNDTGAAGGGGTQLFNRRSTVSLSGPFGEFRIGRDYTATFWNDTTFDPFGTNGVGTNVINAAHSAVLTGAGFASDSTTVRSNNMVGYFLPANLGGFYGQAQYAFHENTKTDGSTFDSKANEYAGARFGYANGPLDVAVAYGETTVVSTAAQEVKVKTANLGASYDLGVVKLFGELSRVTNDFSPNSVVFGSDSVDLDGALIGVTAPIGAGLIRASYSTVKAKVDNAADPKANKFALGYVHNLSKRTALYATVARISNKDGANISVSGNLSTSATKNSTGYDFGIRHAF
ncbi:porin [Variovorax ginsengisoli]|uniref:Porin n=1 Tax=Variovorax ginsengisoli TaxID=363844 RepID=A0ABT9S896_9BURK|nr:porin [Variovorax ginsengisoli]MDP9900569.1 putative porin [Variovorax ginsengisoli]